LVERKEDNKEEEIEKKEKTIGVIFLGHNKN
jgi:hypothetical protein